MPLAFITKVLKSNAPLIFLGVVLPKLNCTIPIGSLTNVPPVLLRFPLISNCVKGQINVPPCINKLARVIKSLPEQSTIPV